MKSKPGALYYFTLAMTGLYVLGGLYMIFSPVGNELLPGKGHIILGIVMILYSVYRIYRLKQLQKMVEREKNRFEQPE